MCEVKQRKNREQYIASVWVLFWLFRGKKKMIVREKNFGLIEHFTQHKEGLFSSSGFKGDLRDQSQFL